MSDIEEIKRATPYLRSGVALRVYMAGRRGTIADAYETADEFLETLYDDMEKAS